MGQLGSPKPPFVSLYKNIYFTNNLYLGYGTPMPNFRIIRSFFTDLRFLKKMGQLGPPKPPFY